ncbi:MAG: class I SAM-dependent rRNA methyltransferase [Nitrospinota bacterium]
MPGQRSPTVYLKAHRPPRVEAGHPWVYRSEVGRVAGEPAPGEIVNVRNSGGYLLGRGYINPRSEIIIRLLTRQDEPVDKDFFCRKIRASLDERGHHLKGTNAYRAIFSEGDGLPGLTVDVYGDYLVVQLSTLGMEKWRGDILPILIETFSPKGIYERSDIPSRGLEGLPEAKGLLFGEVPERVSIFEDDLTFLVDVAQGQKTGFFLDQRENRRAVRQWFQGNILDCFCYSGAFSAHAAGRAERVLGVDISPGPLALAKEHFELNRLAVPSAFLASNCFDMLRALEARGASFDGIILDPPAMARGASALPRARRAHKELNLRALKLLRPGGLLATSSCSARLSREEFWAILAEAARDSRRGLKLLHEGRQPLDHPVLLAVPETRYLKFFIFRVEEVG